MIGKTKDRAVESNTVKLQLSESQLSKLLKRVTVDPSLCHGEPCIRGMRIMVKTIINSLKDDMSVDEILLRYPDLTYEDIDAAIIYSHRR
jgi:uncharacterized protein (DUF433 family)